MLFHDDEQLVNRTNTGLTEIPMPLTRGSEDPTEKGDWINHYSSSRGQVCFFKRSNTFLKFMKVIVMKMPVQSSTVLNLLKDVLMLEGVVCPWPVTVVGILSLKEKWRSWSDQTFDWSLFLSCLSTYFGLSFIVFNPVYTSFGNVFSRHWYIFNSYACRGSWSKGKLRTAYLYYLKALVFFQHGKWVQDNLKFFNIFCWLCNV